MQHPISADLLRFLEANIASVEQLEILRVLSESPEATLSDAELARACQIRFDLVAEQLHALQGRGLLRLHHCGSQLLAEHGADTSDKRAALGGLLEYYRERPVTLIRLIYARTDERLRALSESFRFGETER